MQYKKTLLTIFFTTFLVSCGGGNSSNSNPKNLTTPPSLKNLFDNIQKELRKSEFESTIDYENRINNFSDSLTGYHGTDIVNATYDADRQELTIDNPYGSIFEGENKYSVAFNTGYSNLRLENLYDLYIGETIQSKCITSTKICDYKKYRVLSVPASQAEKIINGFRIDYSFSFSTTQIRKTKNTCVSANFTNCTNFLYADVKEFRIYNVVNDEVY